MSWQPNEQEVQNVLQLLHSAQHSRSNEEHRAVHQRLDEFSKNVVFLQYLCYVFVHLPPQTDNALGTRELAGLLLKNGFSRCFAAKTLNEEAFNYVKLNVLPMLGSSDQQLRNTASSLVSRIVACTGIHAWKELLTFFGQAFENPANELVLLGTFQTMLKITEDSGSAFDSEEAGRPLNVLIPKWLSFFNHPNPEIRSCALQCVNNYSGSMPAALIENTPLYLEGLSALTQDTDNRVRKHVCEGLVMLLTTRLDIVAPHMGSLIQFFISASRDQDEAVALEALAFWQEICTHASLYDTLQNHLGQVLPLLISLLVYSAEEIASMEADDEDDSVADRPEDLKPMFHKSNRDGFSKAKDGDDDDDDDDDDDMWQVEEVTVRKRAARSLVAMCACLPASKTLPVMLPIISQLVANENWIQQESGLLALSTITDPSCIEALTPHLETLYSMLLSKLDSPYSPIKETAVWTLSQYASFIKDQPDSLAFQTTVKKMLMLMTSRKKKMQRMACSAFSSFVSAVEDHVSVYLSDVVKVIAMAFGRYQVGSTICLLDVVATLFEVLGEDMADPQYLEVLMPPLVGLWERVGDEDRLLLTIFETFAAIASSVGVAFAPYAQMCFDRCRKIIENTNIFIAGVESAGEAPGSVDREIMICAIDLITAMAEGLEDHFVSLAAGSNLCELIRVTINDTDFGVIQSVLALVGDMCRGSFQIIEPLAPMFVTACSKFLKVVQQESLYEIEDSVHVTNNACWALGMLATRMQERLEPMVGTLLEPVFGLLLDTDLENSIIQNAAVTIARLLACAPAKASNFFDDTTFIRWCTVLHQVSRYNGDGVETNDGFKALCLVARQIPRVVLSGNCFGFLCAAFVFSQSVSNEMEAEFRVILTALKRQLVEQGRWESVYNEFNGELRDRLQNRFGI